ncbi:hypothetical protein DF186_23860, partial [Enterococcus hirae]
AHGGFGDDQATGLAPERVERDDLTLHDAGGVGDHLVQVHGDEGRRRRGRDESDRQQTDAELFLHGNSSRSRAARGRGYR